jgi:hypothetical protein
MPGHTRAFAPGIRDRTARSVTGTTSPPDQYVDNDTRIYDSLFP